MIEEHRKELGITPRKISDEEIVQRLVFSLVNEAATSWKRASPARPATSTWSTSPATASRCTAAARCATPTQVGLFNVVQAMKRFAQNPLDDASVLAARAAAGQAGGRRQDLQLKACPVPHTDQALPCSPLLACWRAAGGRGWPSTRCARARARWTCRRCRRWRMDEQGAAESPGGGDPCATVSAATTPAAQRRGIRTLHAHLQQRYPRVHATLKREVVGGHSLLYTWPGSDPRPSPWC
jgi:hypothetical protein